MTNKVLLAGINAKYIHSNPAIYSLKAYADKYYPNRPDGCQLEIAEYTINQPAGSILAGLYGKKPQVIALSCYIWNRNTVQDLLAELPKILPDTDLWLGGPEAAHDARRLMQEFPRLTGIMLGEGEETFTELLQYYWEQKHALRDIRGIVCRDGFTGERGLPDINRLPFIYATPDAFENRIIYYESQRGCPFQCSYCLSAIDKIVRLRDISMVKSELQFFLDHKVAQVKFVDRTFNCNSRHALAIWDYLAKNDNGVTNFHFEIAADLLTEAQLEVIKSMRPGLIQFEIGVQSTNAATLEAVNRHTDIGALRKAAATVHGFGNTHQHLDLIAGLPYEDYDTFAASFDDVYAMAPDQLQLGFLKVLKGSPIEKRATEYGIVCGSKPPYEVLCTKWLAFDDVLRLKGIEEMVEIYYNSNQFSHTLPVLAGAFDSPFRMYEALAEFYRVNGYFVITPARSSRYKALLDFACSVAEEKRGLFAELLTFDLYLRENMKSRPAFCPENRIERERLRQFYAHEASARQYLSASKYDNCTSAQLLKMTHIEAFTYPVWEENPVHCMGRLETEICILFDYENRSALTHDAAFYQIAL